MIKPKDENYQKAMEFGCVDLRLHPSEIISKYYGDNWSTIERTAVIDMRAIPLSLRTELMDSLAIYWETSENGKAGHRKTCTIKKLLKSFAIPEIDRENESCEFEIPKDQRQELKTLIASLVKTEETADNNDIWEISKMAIAEAKLNSARPVRRFDFSSISNEKSKEILKEYIAHLIYETSLMISSIYDTSIELRAYARFFPTKCVSQIEPEDIERFEEHTLSRGTLKSSYRKIVQIRKFHVWQYEKGIAKTNPFEGYYIWDDSHRGIVKTAPDDYVLSQIQAMLPCLPLEEKLQFLILKCTGMRISELCLLKRSCLEKTSNGDCFIRFWNQKMQKDVQNVIPSGLYEMITEYISLIPAQCDYLFTQDKDRTKPARCATTTKHLCKAFAEAGIKNPDGTKYVFKPHGLRHKMAVQLVEIAAPYSIIQEQLHHASPDMSVAYMEIDMRKKAAKVNKFINADGVEKPCFIATEQDIVENKVDWMKKSLNAQILPNGVCSKPIKLGACTKSNACFDCPDFRTSAAFIGVHKEQLEQTKTFIEAAKKAGWVQQLKGAQALKTKLERIIVKLED